MSKKRRQYTGPVKQPETPKTPEPKKSETSTFLGFEVPLEKRAIIYHIIILVAISFAVKIFTIYLTQAVGSFMDYYDMSYYYERFGLKILAGQIPYVDFTVDYPQGILLTILIPLAISAFTGSGFGGFVFVHQSMMFLFDAGTVIMIYLIGLKLYNKRNAFIAAFLYATAFSSAYFVLTKYDAFPTFLLMLSIALYIYRRDVKSYLACGLAFLVKWFPAVSLPYFVINDLKTGIDKKTILKNIAYTILLVLIVFVPFFIASPAVFWDTYVVNLNVPALSHGFSYYLDFITGTSFFGDYSLLFVIIAEIALLGLYYRESKRDDKTTLKYIMFAVFAFVVMNRAQSPQHLMWIMPFFALYLAGGFDFILFYATQCVLFIEFPLAYGVLYDNTVGYGVGHGPFFVISAIILFTAKYVLLFIPIIVIARRKNGEIVDAGTSGSNQEKPAV